MTIEKSTLYVVATPIGNLADVTLRALEVLAGVDVVYAEDTRVSGVLLKKFGVATPLRSYREAASRDLVERTITEILESLRSGKSLALVSDAGTPGVSDPGDYLVRRVNEAGYAVVSIPGPSAVVALLAIAGRGIGNFLFEGFLPKKKGHQTRLAQLRELLGKSLVEGVVLYESPERVIKLLDELGTWELPLHVTIGRELTKLHEEVLRGDLVTVRQELSARKKLLGEFVILVSLATITE